ncbi:MAG: prepilin-type N-terminal cleavage/methylation domain-containing protein [Puniceicoccales bacterium]|nr:prepilin-type N-terminal cleavage/methylation domain-containing protein [Puniceicoccales bacterium]
MKGFRSKTSFSLAELMVAIAIMAIFGMLSYRAVRSAINRVHRAKAANNLRTIAHAHAQFISDFGHPITFSEMENISINGLSDVNSFAAVLAKYGYIEDVSIWAWDFDYKIKAYKKSSLGFPSKIYDKSTDKVQGNFQGGKFPLSVVCGIVRCPNLDYKTLLKGKFPAAYSRGLQSNGYWLESSAKDRGGVFGRKGGLIAYYDGTVEWCENVVNKFVNYLNQRKTSHICEAIPNAHNSIQEDGEMPSNFLDWTGSDACDL